MYKLQNCVYLFIIPRKITRSLFKLTITKTWIIFRKCKIFSFLQKIRRPKAANVRQVILSFYAIRSHVFAFSRVCLSYCKVYKP